MPRRRKETRRVVANVRDVRRLNNSKSGNPRFQFYFTDHERRRTMSDNMVGNFLAGVEHHFIGTQVTLTLERSNGHEYIVGVVGKQ